MAQQVGVVAAGGGADDIEVVDAEAAGQRPVGGRLLSL
jgi:hypothetical protein